MKKIKFMLEYKCLPVWIAGEDGSVDNELPEELSDNQEFVRLIEEISSEYTSLFTDKSIEFSYNGFADKKAENAFNNKVFRAVAILQSELKDKNIIEIIYK